MYYNYEEQMMSDIMDALRENHNDVILDLNTIGEERTKEKRQEAFRTYDDITGNWSWSYTFNTAKARENLEGNEDLVERTVETFGIDMGKHRNDYEFLDVSVRCLLLYEVFDDAREERKNDHVRECDECWQFFDEWYCIDWGYEYFCSEECLKSKYTEKQIEDMDIGGDESESYWTCWNE